MLNKAIEKRLELERLKTLKQMRALDSKYNVNPKMTLIQGLPVIDYKNSYYKELSELTKEMVEIVSLGFIKEIPQMAFLDRHRFVPIVKVLWFDCNLVKFVELLGGSE